MSEPLTGAGGLLVSRCDSPVPACTPLIPGSRPPSGRCGCCWCRTARSADAAPLQNKSPMWKPWSRWGLHSCGSPPSAPPAGDTDDKTTRWRTTVRIFGLEERERTTSTGTQTEIDLRTGDTVTVPPTLTDWQVTSEFKKVISYISYHHIIYSIWFKNVFWFGWSGHENRTSKSCSTVRVQTGQKVEVRQSGTSADLNGHRAAEKLRVAKLPVSVLTDRWRSGWSSSRPFN